MRITHRMGMASMLGVGMAMLIATTVSAQGRPGFGPGFGPGGPGRGGPPEPGEMLKRMDKNKDGKLTKDEVPDQLWTRLSQADANDDDAITNDELAKMVGARFGRGGPARGPRGGEARAPSSRGPGPGAGGPPRRGKPDTRTGPPSRRPAAARSESQKDEAKEAATKDKPKRREAKSAERQRRPRPAASRPERGEFAEKVFDRLDADGDGSISKEEFKKSFESRFASARSVRGPMGIRGSRGQGPGRAMMGRHLSMRHSAGSPWARAGRSWRQTPQPWRGFYRGGAYRGPRPSMQHGQRGNRGFSQGGQSPFGRRGSGWKPPHVGPYRGPAAGGGGPGRGHRGPGGFRFGAIDPATENVVSDSELSKEGKAVTEVEIAETSDATADVIATEAE
jgi:hypothetical protein